MSGTFKTDSICFIWDNLGPMHIDRCSAIADLVGGNNVNVIELHAKSFEYDWSTNNQYRFKKFVLNQGTFCRKRPPIIEALRLINACLKTKSASFFFCHYERLEIFLAATALRLFGKKVFVMGDSKYDDYPRSNLREVLKTLFYIPYCGAICGSSKTKEYLEFLSFRKNIYLGYNTLDIQRLHGNISRLSQEIESVKFEDRDFVAIARLIPKKNLFTLVEAFRIYCQSNSSNQRKLNIIGSGECETALRQKVTEYGLSDQIIFHGFLQEVSVCEKLVKALILILPSTEEQFGNVVIEAIALKIPVLISDRVGARYDFVRSSLNGFICEPDNPEGFAFYMNIISSDEKLWGRLSSNSKFFWPSLKSSKFTDSVLALVGET